MSKTDLQIQKMNREIERLRKVFDDFIHHEKRIDYAVLGVSIVLWSTPVVHETWRSIISVISRTV